MKTGYRIIVGSMLIVVFLLMVLTAPFVMIYEKTEQLFNVLHDKYDLD